MPAIEKDRYVMIIMQENQFLLVNNDKKRVEEFSAGKLAQETAAQTRRKKKDQN